MLERAWGFDWNPWTYYSEAFDAFVRSALGWILLGFFIILIIIVVVSFFKGGGESVITVGGAASTFGMLGLLAIFMIASTVCCIGNFFGSIDWNVFGQYYGELVNHEWAYITAGVIAAAVLIIGFFFMGPWSILAGLLTYPVVLYVAGFVIYLVIGLIWFLFRFLYVIITSLGISFYQAGAILWGSIIGNVVDEHNYMAGWGQMEWNPWYYYSNAFDSFVNSTFVWFFVAFGALALISSIIVAIRHFKKGGYGEDLTSKIGRTIWYCTLILILLFVVVSTIFCCVAFFSMQHYDVVTDYYTGLVFRNWPLTIICLVATAVVAVAAFVPCMQGGFLGIGFWFTSIFFVFAILYFGVGFVIYALAYYLWMLLRFIYIVFAAIGISIYQLAKNYWYVLLSIIGVPSVLYGLILAAVGYVNSFRENVSLELTGGYRYHGATNFGYSSNNEDIIEDDDVEEENNDDDDIIISDDLPEVSTPNVSSNNAAPSTPVEDDDDIIVDDEDVVEEKEETVPEKSGKDFKTPTVEGYVVKSDTYGMVMKIKKKVGDKVKKGDVLIDVKLLKVDTKITSPIDGTIAEVLAEEAKYIVEEEPVMVIKPIEEETPKKSQKQLEKEAEDRAKQELKEEIEREATLAAKAEMDALRAQKEAEKQTQKKEETKPAPQKEEVKPVQKVEVAPKKEEAKPAPAPEAPKTESRSLKRYAFSKRITNLTKKDCKEVVKEEGDIEHLILPPHALIEDGALSVFKKVVVLVLPMDNLKGSTQESYISRIFGLRNDYSPSTLAEIIIPEGTVEVGRHVFSNNISHITSISIPSTLEAFKSEFSTEKYLLTNIENNSKLRVKVDAAEGDKKAVFASGYINPIKRIKYISITEVDGKKQYLRYSGSESSITIAGGIKSIHDYALSNLEYTEEVIILDTVKTLGNYIFSNSSLLKKVSIPSNLKELPEGLFNDCGALESVNIPEGITSIGKNAFYKCSSITSLNFSKTPLETIGNTAFSYCVKLENIVLPKTLKEISNSAFTGCKALLSITYKGSTNQWSKIKIGKVADGSTIMVHCSNGDVPLKTQN